MNAQDYELKRLQELALRAHHTSLPCFTRFLEPALEMDARRIAAQAQVKLAFWGGYEDAERRIAAFYAQAEPERAEYPLGQIEIKWNSKFSSPGHRDLLGAVMGLGLERDSTGDIAFAREDGCAVLFAHEDMLQYISANLDSARRTALRARVSEKELALKEIDGSIIRITVNSPRLDAVLAAALKLSRSEAQSLIESGKVKCNHIESDRSDQKLEVGDLLSVRGRGRMRIEGFDGSTRKGREAIRLFIYTR